MLFFIPLFLCLSLGTSEIPFAPRLMKLYLELVHISEMIQASFVKEYIHYSSNLNRKWREFDYYFVLVPHPPAAPAADAIASICSLDKAKPGDSDLGVSLGYLDRSLIAGATAISSTDRFVPEIFFSPSLLANIEDSI
jgi:hypothetical protein